MTVPEKKSVKDLEDWRQAIRHSILNFSTKKCGLQFYPNLSPFYLCFFFFFVLISQVSAHVPFSESPSLSSSDYTYLYGHVVLFSLSEIILFTYMFTH